MKKIMMISAILSLILSGVILYIAFEHNAQGEIFDPQTGGVNWEYVMTLELINFFSIFIVLFIIGGVGRFIFKKRA